ncbi:hypothetical protein GALMADRAFT_216244 [Galerina marginata CBS 339.88]|uniref:Uncharacterized protein n=1 Tax=Galerina marginata (strain CBS 339.88) TaxID=685588 RepID=A0A067S9M2_GALM3|nr:hypothetical protein GALMADRAFT_216244 [Galerina marginata CBS 339.88]
MAGGQDFEDGGFLTLRNVMDSLAALFSLFGSRCPWDIKFLSKRIPAGHADLRTDGQPDRSPICVALWICGEACVWPSSRLPSKYRRSRRTVSTKYFLVFVVHAINLAVHAIGSSWPVSSSPAVEGSPNRLQVPDCFNFVASEKEVDQLWLGGLYNVVMAAFWKSMSISATKVAMVLQ